MGRKRTAALFGGVAIAGLMVVCYLKDRDPDLSPLTPEALVGYLGSLERSRSGDEFRPEKLRCVETAIRSVDSVDSLRRLFFICYDEYERIARRQVYVPEYHFDTLLAIIFRLSDLRTPQSAKTLVDIFMDKLTYPNAALSEFLCKAISECGKPCLPYLHEIDLQSPRRKVGEDLIQAIQQGRVLF